MEQPNIRHSTAERKIVKHPEKAVWNTRKYHRHNVEDDVKSFCGWALLLKLIGCATTKSQKRLIAFAFATGGRISEVLQLQTTMFELVKNAKPPILIVRGMPLVKKYKKVGEFVECLKCHLWNPKGSIECEDCGENLLRNGRKRFQTEKLRKDRSEFVIRLDEPTSKIVATALIERMKENEPLIFKSPYSDMPYGRRWAYKVLRRIGDRAGVYLYPHKLRSERACHLGASLKAESLLEWFSWEHWKTAKRYAKKGAIGLAKEMGVQLPKRVRKD